MEKYEPLRKWLKKNSMPELTDRHITNINVSEKNGFYIYNYNNNVLVPRNDPIIRLCRGITLNINGDIVNFPFRRFFNAHEPECDKIDWNSAEVLEKIDGSLVCVWWDGNDWEVTTRGSFYPVQDSLNFKDIFCRLFNGFDKLQKGFTYIFELVSKDNRIVTMYDEEFVVLIGCRDLTQALCEFDQDSLDVLAKELGVKRPVRYSANNVDECKKLFENLRDDEEGLVVVDKNFNRMKLKQESYLKMSKIMKLKEQDILDYINGEFEIDPDYLDLPEVKEKIEYVESVKQEVLSRARLTYDTLNQHTTTQKEFALEALKHPFSNIMFELRKPHTTYETISNKLKWKQLKEIYNKIILPTDDTLIILRGVPASGKSTWIKNNNLEKYTICPDKIRMLYSTPKTHINQDNDRKVWRTLYDILETRMSNGEFTIIDGTHTTNKSIIKYKKLAKKYWFGIIIIDFKISLNDAVKRNKKRKKYKQVPEDVIKKMHKSITQTFINTKILEII